MEWLRDFLKMNPQPAGEVLKAGQKEGFSKRQVYKAKKSLGVVSEKPDDGTRHQKEWTLPEAM